jgi:peptide chain release factor
LAINPEKQRLLQEALVRLKIREEDVVERFIRSGGAGGQKVNKTSSAVYLKHLPTGLEIKMQKERSQSLNRFLAWRLLTEKVEGLQEGKSPNQLHIEKLRKQKNRRLRRAKGKKVEDPEILKG